MRLRAVEPSDVVMMYDIENDPDIRSVSSHLAPLSMSALSRYVRETTADPFIDRQLRLIIELDDDTAAGIIDLYDINPVDRTAMVGIVILPQYRRRKLALNALNEIARYAGEVLNLRALAAKISDNNKPSLNLFEAAGYATVGIIPDWLLTKTETHDMHILWRAIQ